MIAGSEGVDVEADAGAGHHAGSPRRGRNRLHKSACPAPGRPRPAPRPAPRRGRPARRRSARLRSRRHGRRGSRRSGKPAGSARAPAPCGRRLHPSRVVSVSTTGKAGTAPSWLPSGMEQPVDHRGREERARRVVDQHHVGIAYRRQPVPHRLAPRRAADDRGGEGTRSHRLPVQPPPGRARSPPESRRSRDGRERRPHGRAEPSRRPSDTASAARRRPGCRCPPPRPVPPSVPCSAP